MIAAFEAARGAGENDFGHCWSLAKSTGFIRLSADETPRYAGRSGAVGLGVRTALGELEAAF
jgi:hypothetical protein